ncbi:MAG TPA: cohesin domain-containing protein [Saprospiraceae bacterium]|nr:cohesin domain-containing protein [Saprospiraceae bacterium]
MFSKVLLRLLTPLLAICIHFSFLNAQSFWERDLNFGNSGTVRIGGGREEESIKSLALLPDGKILAAGRYSGDLSFIIARYLPGGQLDASFGVNGKVAFQLGSHAGEANGIITLPDGRFILGATDENATGLNVFTLVRFLPEGVPDNTFGANGVAKSTAAPDSYHKLNAIARQPDGKIVAAGSTNVNTGPEDQQSATLCRFTANGGIDNSFGVNGMVRLTYSGERYEFNALAFQPDGRIVAAGSNLDRIIVARFESNGAIDSTFGFNGVKFLQYSAAGKTRCRAISLLSDGKILLGAWCWEYWLNNGAIAIRLLSDGSLDPTFHNGGMSFIHCNYQLNTSSMTLQNDGKIVLAAAGLNNDPWPATGIFRYHPNGAPDSSFAQNGAWVNPVGNENSALYAVLSAPNGKILAGGVAKKYLDFDFALLRLQNDGTPDPGFGENGLVCTDFGWGYDWASSVHPRPGGKILLAENAHASGDFIVQDKCVLAQFMPDGTPDYGFGNGGRDSFPGGALKSVIFQNDGKMLVGTDGFWEGYVKPAALFRRLPEGGPDSVFGKFGCIDSVFGTYNSPVLLQAGILSNGKIVVAGSVNRPTTFRDYILTCFNPDGSRDLSFGDNGFVLVDFNNKNDEVYGLSVQADNKILLAGNAWNGGIAKKDIVVMRFLPNGAFDNTWGQNGILLDDFEAPVSENVTYMTFTPGGKLLLAIQRQMTADVFENAMFDNALARYNPDGSPDPTFGDNGRVIMPVSTPYAGSRYIRQIAFLPSGKIMTSAYLPPASMDPDSFAVEMHRYMPNGTPDTLPSAYSVISDRWGKVFRGFAITMVPAEGVVWLAGSSLFDFELNEDVVLARYRTDPACVKISVRSVIGKGLDDTELEILPASPVPSCPANNITMQCADETLCPCSKDATFIVPHKDDNPLNGVSTFDMVLISRHILGIEPLNSPYKIIAADVNKSNSITTFDIVEIRKLILGINQAFTNTTSWRFIRKDFTFPNPANPFATSFPEKDTVFTFEPDERPAFLAVKSGDVNQTHLTGCDNLIEPEPRQSLSFNAMVCPVAAGKLLTVPVAFAENADCAAWQAALRFDDSALELVEVQPGELESLDADNFGLTNASSGSIRVLWYSEDGRGQVIEAGKTLFRLVFRAKKDMNAGELYVSTDESVLACLAFRPDGEAIHLSLSNQFQPCPASVPVKFQVLPNPVGTSACFAVDSGEAVNGEIYIYNSNGTLCHRQTITSTGSPQYCFSEAAAWPSGVYIWRFTGDGGATGEGKFLKQ